jgi:aconitase B
MALGWMKKVKSELKKVQYPFIGMTGVPKKLGKAAQHLSDGLPGKAHKEASKVIEKSDDEKLIEYAESMVEKIENRIDAKFDRVRVLKSMRRYHEAVELLEYLEGKACEGLETQEDAREELQEVKEDEDAQLELKAWKVLAKVKKSNEKAKSNADKKKNLSKFYEKNKGTAAAEEAQELAQALK